MPVFGRLMAGVMTLVLLPSLLLPSVACVGVLCYTMI